MERREAVHTLEEELIRCAQLTQRAGYLVQDLLNDFFIYGDFPKMRAPVEIPRTNYGPAVAKAEIVGELLQLQFELLDALLDE